MGPGNIPAATTAVEHLLTVGFIQQLEERRSGTMAGKKKGKDKPKQTKEPMKNKGPKKK